MKLFLSSDPPPPKEELNKKDGAAGVSGARVSGKNKILRTSPSGKVSPPVRSKSPSPAVSEEAGQPFHGDFAETLDL